MAHTGGGGGGANYNQTESSPVAISSGTGGSGVVIIRYVLDTDADGISDDDEAKLGSDPSNPDTDGDGEPDGYEVAMGTDPTDANSTVIPDLSTVVDAQIGAASGLDSIEGNLALWLDASNINYKQNAGINDGDAIAGGRIWWEYDHGVQSATGKQPSGVDNIIE